MYKHWLPLLTLYSLLGIALACQQAKPIASDDPKTVEGQEDPTTDPAPDGDGGGAPAGPVPAPQKPRPAAEVETVPPTLEEDGQKKKQASRLLQKLWRGSRGRRAAQALRKEAQQKTIKAIKDDLQAAAKKSTGKDLAHTLTTVKSRWSIKTETVQITQRGRRAIIKCGVLHKDYSLPGHVKSAEQQAQIATFKRLDIALFLDKVILVVPQIMSTQNPTSANVSEWRQALRVEARENDARTRERIESIKAILGMEIPTRSKNTNTVSVVVYQGDAGDVNPHKISAAQCDILLTTLSALEKLLPPVPAPAG